MYVLTMKENEWVGLVGDCLWVAGDSLGGRGRGFKKKKKKIVVCTTENLSV